MIIEPADIDRAERVLRGVAIRTPLLECRRLSEEVGIDLYAKCENVQYTGSFKFRGAYNAISSLTEAQRARGVVTYSSGNHGQGLAAAARRAGTRAVVVMPENVVAAKVEGVERYGGKPLLVGSTIMERQAAAERYADEHGYELIAPADDLRVMAGQATIARELFEQAGELDAVLVPIGAGGLISGVGSAIKAAQPRIRVIGVEPAGKAAAYRSLAAGERVMLDEVETIADGLRANLIGVNNWEVIREVVDEVILASEPAIIEAVRLLALTLKQVVEPAGAVALAALLDGQPALHGKSVAMILSGGNADPSFLASAVGEAASSPGPVVAVAP